MARSRGSEGPTRARRDRLLLELTHSLPQPSRLSGIAHLINDPQSVHPPTPSQLELERFLLLDDIHAQQLSIAQSEADRRSQSAVMELTPAQKEKRDKRIRDKEAKQRLARAIPGEAEEDVFAPESSQAPPPPVASSSSVPSVASLPLALAQAYMLETPSLSSTLPYYEPSAVTYTTLEAAREAGVWTFPSNLDERARSGVFRALWERGYFMGVGIKFGGGFLVYPGESQFTDGPFLRERKARRV